MQWAQRKENVYLTVPLRDFKDEKISITEKEIFITGKSDDKSYEAKIQLFAEIVPEMSKTQIHGT